MKLLDTINSPRDLRALDPAQLPQVAQEIRDFMIDRVSRHGGHLAPSLGAVDLTLALHYCFDTPNDKLVWDVGHQAYAHKIITGRREQFDTLRQYKGLSGFPRVSESPYDALSVGHASTSISAALGMAMARDLKKQSHHVIAVIGDGSLSGGLAFEGLNNLGTRSTDMIVILNDNEMSISKNVGALSRYLTRVLTDKRFNKIKKDIWELLGNMSNVGKSIRSVVHSIDEGLKHLVIPGKLFEDLGLRYFGPVNGHDINELNEVLRFARDSKMGPVLIHVVTKKGKGYRFAEDDATKYHGVGSFLPATGAAIKKAESYPTYSEVFGKTIIELARKDQSIVAITAAMPDGTKLTEFKEQFPERFFDVGIAEAHAVTFAAGLALQGMTPVVALYSSFLQRTYDQLIHDIALDNLHVVFCIDRAGLVGDDGPTHHGNFDLSFLRTIPNVTILAPSSGQELVSALHYAFSVATGPVFVRYPRGTICESSIPAPIAISGCTPVVHRSGEQVAVVSAGHSFALAQQVVEQLVEKGHKPTFVDARFVKPLDTAFYGQLLSDHHMVVTLEHNTLSGGFGSAIAELSSASSAPSRVLRFGYPDTFIEHGDVGQLFADIGLEPHILAEKIVSELAATLIKG